MSHLNRNTPAERCNAGGGSENHVDAGLGTDSSGADGAPGLFEVRTVVDTDAYSRRTTYEFSANEYVRGPGPRPATTGPRDAQAPDWWWEEAERVVLALVNSGHQVSSDTLHEKYPDEP